MNKGKIIVIEGTDCSGKETQSKLLVEKLNKNNFKTIYLNFPRYDTPTGKIVGGSLLGKKEICESFFSDNAPTVDSKVASLYYAADRRYNKEEIDNYLKQGYLIIMDRYTSSNMGHQGGKLKTKEERNDMYEWIYHLEYEMLNLPTPEFTIFLHMPYKHIKELIKKRKNLDKVEIDDEYIINSENAYLELIDKYKFKYINCTKNNEIKTIEEISEEVYNTLINLL